MVAGELYAWLTNVLEDGRAVCHTVEHVRQADVLVIGLFVGSQGESATCGTSSARTTRSAWLTSDTCLVTSGASSCATPGNANFLS